MFRKFIYLLENFLSNEKNLIVDRFAAGCFLFALFSRSRWSDLRCVYGYAADILEVEGKITGHLETARLVQKQGLSMPLVASVWEVGNIPWVLEFIEVSKLADRPLDTAISPFFKKSAAALHAFWMFELKCT